MSEFSSLLLHGELALLTCNRCVRCGWQKEGYVTHELEGRKPSVLYSESIFKGSEMVSGVEGSPLAVKDRVGDLMEAKYILVAGLGLCHLNLRAFGHSSDSLSGVLFDVKGSANHTPFGSRHLELEWALCCRHARENLRMLDWFWRAYAKRLHTRWEKTFLWDMIEPYQRPKSLVPLVSLNIAAFYTGVVGAAITEQLYKVCISLPVL
eukprot:Gb_25166 [translate_table: standard]